MTMTGMNQSPQIMHEGNIILIWYFNTKYGVIAPSYVVQVVALLEYRLS